MHVNHVPVALIHPITNAYFVHPGNSPLSLTQLNVKPAQLERSVQKEVQNVSLALRVHFPQAISVLNVNQDFSPPDLVPQSVRSVLQEPLARKVAMTANNVQKDSIQITLNVFHVNLGRIPMCQVCPLVKNARLELSATLLEVLDVRSAQMPR